MGARAAQLDCVTVRYLPFATNSAHRKTASRRSLRNPIRRFDQAAMSAVVLSKAMMVFCLAPH
jgi:hypothetical protein